MLATHQTYTPKNGYSAPRSHPLWSVLPTSLILLLAITFGTSSYLHSQLLTLGQSIWNDYGMLRHAMQEPSCDVDFDVERRIAAQIARAEEQTTNSILPPRPPNPNSIRRSLEAQRLQCAERHQTYSHNQSLRQSSLLLVSYSKVESAVGGVAEMGLDAQKYLLVGIILLCALVGTLQHSHISLRAIRTRRDAQVSALFQVGANLLLLLSALHWRSVAMTSSDTATPWIHWFWIIGFSGLALAAIWQLLHRDRYLPVGGNWLGTLLTIPVYTYMALISGLYFLLAEHYEAGMAVQLIKMVKYADLYINVALYVWVGMLLKQTRLAHLLFDAIRPWKLAPELITIVVVLLAALPTAFTGASGIFLIAVGGLIYHEIRMSGARRPLAFAATAMSGSMGVVLNPCLMVVIIASLNKQVTTTQLFDTGHNVFILTAILFSAMVLLTRRSPLGCAPAREALPASLKALIPLLPYVAIATVSLIFFHIALNQSFNEFSAPTILPVTLIFLLAYDVWSCKRQPQKQAAASDQAPTVPTQGGFWQRMIAGTAESSIHIGALLMLMALSVVLGGVMERAGVMELFPTGFTSVWIAMTFLVAVLVLIGMFMEPYGAIILVSATIASIAYQSGIDPVHFWMVVLLAFELGYLTPPIALNQILTRQVVGDEEMDQTQAESQAGNTWWQRHECLVMPVTVMAIALLLVAYVPLALGN